MLFTKQLKPSVFLLFIFFSLAHTAPNPDPTILSFLRDDLSMSIESRSGHNFSAQRGDITVEVNYTEYGTYQLTMSRGEEILFRSWGKDFKGGHGFYHFEISDETSFLDFATCYLGYFSFMETTEWHREVLRFIHETQGLEYFQVSSDLKQSFGIKVGSQRANGTTKILELNVMRNKNEVYLVQINNFATYEPQQGLPNNKSHGTSIGFKLDGLDNRILGINLLQPYDTALPLQPMFYKFIMWMMDYCHLNTLKFSDVWPQVLLDPRDFIRDIFAYRAGEFYNETSSQDGKELTLKIRWYNAPNPPAEEAPTQTREEVRERVADALTRGFERENLDRPRLRATEQERVGDEISGREERLRVEWLSTRIHTFHGRSSR